MARAVVLGGSRGIGRAIADSLQDIGMYVTAASSSDVDTGDIEGVTEFCRNAGNIDVLVLNTGGPPPKRFEDTKRQDWEKYHNQLFVGFVTILQNARVNDNGYIFLVSSGVIREPVANLVISCAYRAAFAEVFKIQSKEYAKRQVSCINIAPGLINTDRTGELLGDAKSHAKTLPMSRLGEPGEIGRFVSAIVQNRIKYLSGVTINFDGAASSFVF